MAEHKLKVGVIGAGSMGQHHIRVYSNMKNVELIGIADVQKDRVKSIADKHGTNYFTDKKDLLKEKPDAVSIAVPTALHKDAALAYQGRKNDVRVDYCKQDSSLQDLSVPFRKRPVHFIGKFVGLLLSHF